MSEEQLHQQIEAAQKELGNRARRKRGELISQVLEIVGGLECGEAIEILDTAKTQLRKGEAQNSPEPKETTIPTNSPNRNMSSIGGSKALGAIL